MLAHSFVASAAFAVWGASSDAAQCRAQMVQVSVGVHAAQCFALIVAIAAQPYAVTVLPEWLLALGNGSVSLKGIVLLLGVGAALWIVGLCSYNIVTTGRSRASSSPGGSCIDTQEFAAIGAVAVMAFAA